MEKLRTIAELNKEELNELRVEYLAHKQGDSISYEQMYNIENYVSNQELFNEYNHYVFSEEDFFCNVNKEDKEEYGT